ncbi:MAG: hypothetical protein RR357_06430 [Clostridia bacterium]
MLIIKNGFKLFCNNLIFNLIACITLGVASIMVAVSSVYVASSTEYLNAAKKFNEQGLVYLSAVADEGDVVTEFKKEDFENAIDVHRMYNGALKVNGKIANVSAYDEFFMALHDFDIKGRLPVVGANEVLASGDVALGDKLSIDIKGVITEKKVVGILNENSLLIYGQTTSDNIVGLENLFRKFDLTTLSVGIVLPIEDISTIELKYFDRNIFVRYDNNYLTENKNQILGKLTEKARAVIFEDQYNYSKNVYKEESTIFIVVLMVSLLAGLAMVLTNIIMLFTTKIKYFATLYLNGYSIKNIVSLTLVYVSIMAIISCLISLIALSLVLKTMFPGFENVRLLSILLPFAFSLGVAIVGVITIFIITKKINLAEKIGKTE